MIEQRERLTEALKVSSDRAIAARADRMLWLSANTRPVPSVVIGRIEEMALLNQATGCFFDGHFIGSVMVAAAYVEQQLIYELLDRGLTKDDKLRVSDAIKLAKRHTLFDATLLDRIDALAELRNSYAHFRLLTHPTSFAARFQKAGLHPELIRENDAHEGLQVMYEVFHATLR